MGGHIRALPTANGGTYLVGGTASARHFTHRTVCAKGAANRENRNSAVGSVQPMSPRTRTPPTEPRELPGDRNPHQAAHSANRSPQGREKTS